MTDQHRIDHAKAIAGLWIDAYFAQACTPEEMGANIVQTVRTFRAVQGTAARPDASIGEIVRGLPPVEGNVQPIPAQTAGAKT